MEAVYIVILLNALYWAAVLFLISLGLNIILGVGGILNLTHGQLTAFGAYAAAWGILSWGLHAPSFVPFLILLFGVVIAALVGLLTEVLFIRPMYKRRLEYQLLLTYGLLLAYEDVIKVVWGGEVYYASRPLDILGDINIMGQTYPKYFLFVMLVSALAGLGVWYALFKTKHGICLRAVAMDKEMASALGLNTRRYSTLAFVLGAALAGLAGGLVAPSVAVTLGFGLEPLLLAFLVVVIGGLGSLKGALIGSVIIGLLRSIGTATFPEIELAITYLVAVVVLAVRPQGLMGGRG